MNILTKTFISIAAVAGLGGLAIAQTQLPKVKIMGKSFYYYESKKGESLSDIADKFGWDPALLEATNRDVTSRLDPGTLLYYPVGKESRTAQNSNSDGSVAVASSRITHIVKSGETAYGIAKLYNVPLESLYVLNPGIETSGIKKGMTLAIDTSERGVVSDSQAADETAADASADDTPTVDYVYHTVGDGESLYGISKAYNTTVEDLFKLNPGLRSGAPAEGEVIRVLADTDKSERRKETVEVSHVESLSAYKVKRGDSWESIALTYAVPVEALRDANPGIDRIRKGDVLRIPVITTINVEQEYTTEDPRQRHEEGIGEIYNEVHSLGATATADSLGSEKSQRVDIGVAVVLTDIGNTVDEKRNKTNKEMEFSRGALTAVDALKSHACHTRLTIIDGSISQDSVTMALDAFRPQMIVTTSDRSIPAYLVDYAADNKSMVINSFDAKDETYIDNPHVLQYLVPTSYMNSEVTDYMKSAFDGYKLIIAGSPESSDALGASVIQAFAGSGDGVEEVEITGLADLELNAEHGKYLIYGTPTNQKDVKNLLEQVSALRQRNMMSDIRVMGRPNWIPYATALKDLFGENYVYIPSRFYFDPDDPSTKEFISHYESLFNVRPMKASPVYCATSYDIITYFVPNLAANAGDFNGSFTSWPTIQSPIDLTRVSNWGGIVNRGVYIITFSPSGISDRISLPQE
ncbi:MAG: LysM peptidoglycan-binding domain-containing protein [Muribaculaceae bacterium]|nr:LysM peptidoglycan-binding domain-containing protein [Muribaculaceae bacterium]